MVEQLNIFCTLSPTELKNLLVAVNDLNRRIVVQRIKAAFFGDNESYLINLEMSQKCQDQIDKLLNLLKTI